MKYHIYVLQSEKDRGFYVGMTKDLKRRLQKHNHGQVKSTKSRIPLSLVHTEAANDRISARIREKYWKSGVGRETLKTMINAPKISILTDLPQGKSYLGK